MLPLHGEKNEKGHPKNLGWPFIYFINQKAPPSGGMGATLSQIPRLSAG